MREQFGRTERLFGPAGMERLWNAHVIVFGVGGVGGHAVEALARSGIGTLTLVDDDTVCMSNINRQIIATMDTLGVQKTKAAADRIRAISPDTKVITRECFFLPENKDTFDFSQYDYVVDAIDTVSGKLEIIAMAKAAGKPVISCMGMGNKLDPTRIRVTDIEKTSVCPLAKVMRVQLRKRGIRGVQAVWTDEEPIVPIEQTAKEERTDADIARGGAGKRAVPGSNAFVPAVAGLVIASRVVCELAK